MERKRLLGGMVRSSLAGMAGSSPIELCVPNGRDMAHVAGFSAKLARLGSASAVHFSFQGVNFVTPGWMLLTVRALRDFRSARPGTKCKVVQATSQALLYAGNAGFFDALGVPWSRNMGEAPATANYIPITERRVEDLFADQPLYRAAGELVQEDARRLASILTQEGHGIAFDYVSYALREIIRNVIEHSCAERFQVAAQYWPATGVAEVAIGDPGIGISQSLMANSKYSPPDDAAALLLATQAGVSGAFISRRNDDDWANSGYGLYMARGLAHGKQGFVLASGSAALVGGDRGQKVVGAAMTGTCVVLRLRARGVSLEDRLSALLAKVGGSPSRASMSTRVNSGTHQ